MAGALLGVHRDVVCGDCGFASPAAPTFAGSAAAVCPNCGYPANDLESLPDLGGDRVLIDRTAFSIRPPRRWEIVAFRRSSQADQIWSKRVVGLPGESIEIRHGDVYADGRILRKNLAQQRRWRSWCMTPTFSRSATRRPLPRLVASDPKPLDTAGSNDGIRWRADRRGFTHAAGRADGSRSIGCAYHHGRHSPSSRPLRAYNPSQPRGEEDVHAVSDLMLSFRLGHVSGSGTFRVRVRDGRDTFEARLQFQGGPGTLPGLPERADRSPTPAAKCLRPAGNDSWKCRWWISNFCWPWTAKRCGRVPMTGPSRRRSSRRVPWRSARRGCGRRSAVCESTGTCITLTRSGSEGHRQSSPPSAFGSGAILRAGRQQSGFRG